MAPVLIPSYLPATTVAGPAHRISAVSSSESDRRPMHPAPESERACDAAILMVDDCVLYRDSIAAGLAAAGMRPTGCARDLDTMLTAIEDHAPELLLLNIRMRQSASLLRAALATNPAIRVIVLGISEDDEAEVIACAEAGVAGYHTRTESLDDLVLLVKKVVAGETFCSPLVSAMLLRRLSTLASRQTAVPDEPVLTVREAQILELLRLGLSNRDIAGELCIAVHTVKNHVHSLLAKLGVRTRAQAVALAPPQSALQSS
ncbi:LuxR C-terminal-related transcriptional regulator [Mycobacterium sp. C31M]